MLNHFVLAEGPAASVQAASGFFETNAWLMIVLPLAGAALLLVGGKATNAWGHIVATLLSWSAFAVGVGVVMSLLNRDAADRLVQLDLYQWIDTATFDVSIGLRLDPLSLSFVMLITFVGSLIHVYSIAYMSHDVARRRFFAYLNLFVASMLTLVLADNFLLLYMGWEGVGLASFLLIGFWNFKPEYASAANKAFIVNRVGDIGMALAIVSMFAVFGSVSFDDVLAGVKEHGSEHPGWMTFIGLMLLLAACGKSAQFPLQSWLGDAMAGPTPVSALIHAATMVTAGVYLVVRSGPIFEASPTAALAVTIIGAITLVFGAIVGCAKDDIKKALAASTMSQIGYMMLAAGLGPIAYAFAIFHLITHGFFKAGMFLGAGSVMHGMDDQVNMRGYGGLSKHMRITWLTFGAGWLAIIGIPFLSGYYSKDKIIEAAFMAPAGQEWRGWVFGLTTMIVAGMTAFYMSRLFFMTFHGDERWGVKRDGSQQEPHESPALMTIPMIVLAVGSIGLGAVLNYGNGFVHWLEPVVGHVPHPEPVISIPTIQIGTLVMVIIGIAVAWWLYLNQSVTKQASASAGAIIARNDLFQDEVNEQAFIKPIMGTANAVEASDKFAVDKTFSGLVGVINVLGETLRRMNNGFIRSYAASMVLGVIVLALVLIVVK